MTPEKRRELEHVRDTALTEMARAHAVRCLADTRQYEGDRDFELVAFMAVFHPDHPHRPRTRAEARAMRT